jgi:hypothetical protein
MTYILVTGPMGAGKSTFMRSLPKPQGNFIVPNNVPDMMLDYSCELDGFMFYEIDAPTATGKTWIKWLKIADVQIIVANGLNGPDGNFVELWNYLIHNTPDKSRMIILNRVDEIKGEWRNYSNEKIMCIGMGNVIDEETAIAANKDIITIINYLKDKYG